jgi:SAM-dependent methyltransferase
MRFKDISCVACGRQDAAQVALFDIRPQDAGLGLGPLGLARCLGCGLLFIRPQPVFDQKEKELLYGEAYFSADYLKFYADAFAASSNESFQDRLRLIARYKKTGSLLDIGCAAGGFLSFMRAKGWKVSGAEVSILASARARAKGLDIFTGELCDAPFTPGTFDVISAGDVLEHMEDPLDFLRRARALLKEDGILYLALPCADSLYYKFFLRLARLNHRNYFVLPHHLWHFSYKPLSLLLTKAGWRVTEIRRTSSKDLDRGIKKVFGAALRAAAFVLGQQDRIVLIAQKNHDTFIS